MAAKKIGVSTHIHKGKSCSNGQACHAKVVKMKIKVAKQQKKAAIRKVKRAHRAAIHAKKEVLKA